ncbi:hypothetical protein G6F58_013589 [Rhizopus delemar]|nr:hypothetical protein G6F58_013589 [Rhizopus delemar]
MPEHLSAGFGQLWVAPTAVEQAHAQVGFEVGDGGADRRLGLAQPARCRRERAERCGFDEGLQGFRRVGH